MRSREFAWRGIVVVALFTLLAVAPALAQTGSRAPGKGPGSDLPVPDVAHPEAVILAEGFDDITLLAGAGWSLQNLSAPVGTTGWFQGNSGVFPAQAGAPTAYIGANFNNTAGAGTIDNWLITPVLDFATVERCRFYTRKASPDEYADRLEVRYSTAGSSTNVADFTTLALEINPTLILGVYPVDWTEFTVNAPGSGSGRLAFRYWVTSGGPSGTNSDYIGIDSLVCESLTPDPVAATATVVGESCAPGNSAIDPGEAVAVDLCVTNAGALPTVDLVGTLQATGGVENPSGPMSFGGIAPAATVCRTFSFNADFAASCGGNLQATLALQDGAASYPDAVYTLALGAPGAPATTSFSNAGAITIPTTGSPGLGSPYPSTIAVAGLTGAVTQVTVTITGYTHTWPSDVDLVLVGPTGAALVLMSDAGGTGNASNITMTFDDAAAALVPQSADPTAGSWRPTNYTAGDNFPAPGPGTTYSNPATAGTATLASVFAGLDPNGTWSLYLVDDASGDGGSIAGGWSLSITTQGPPSCCQQACTLMPFESAPVPNEPGLCSAVVTYDALGMASGICGLVTCTPPSGSAFPVGTTPVTCTPEAPGAPATSNVVVEDTEPPLITCPADPLVTTNDPNGANVTWPAPVATDNCSVTVSCVPPSGSLFPLGVTPVSCIATDPATLTAACGFNATVELEQSVLEIPTLAPAGLAGLALLLAGGAVALLRRRRA